MANLNDDTVKTSASINARSKRKLCIYCNKSYHRNSLARHQKSCGTKVSKAVGGKTGRSSASGSDDEGVPPKLCLFSEVCKDSCRRSSDDSFSSEEIGSEPPKLQSVKDATMGMTEAIREMVKQRTTGRRKSRCQSIGILRRASLDQYGMTDTPSEHSESNDSFKIHRGHHCGAEQYRFRSQKTSNLVPQPNVSRVKQSVGATRSLVRRSTSQHFKNHVERKPIQEPSPVVSAESYSCQLCRETFQSHCDLSSHGFKYLQRGILVCMLCSNKQVDDLDLHIKSEHQSDKKKVMCALCQTLVDRNNYVSHIKEHHTVVKKFECDLCNIKFGILQNLLYHKSTDHLKEVQHSKYCQRNGDMMSVIRMSGVYSEDKLTHVTKYGSRSSVRVKHLSHSEILKGESVIGSKIEHKRVLNSLSTRIAAVNYVENLGSVGECSADEDFDSRRSSCSTEGSNSSSSDNSSCCSSIGCEGYHSTSRGSSGANALSLEDKSKNYICQLCGVTWSGRLVYLRHLKEDHHWTKDKLLDPEYDPDIWCPECGLEFVVRPTLMKHLVVAHDDINCPEMYMELAGYGRRPLLSHQCSVCFNVFDSDPKLAAHFRCHGLAYLAYLSKGTCKC